MNQRKPLQQRIPVGVQYHRPPVPPPEEWKSDLEHIAKIGLDHIYLWASWCSIERSPGEYHWDELEQLVDIAAEHDIDVIPNLDPWAVPAWAESDEYRVVELDGTPRPFASSIIHSLYGGRPCLDNRELRAILEKFFRTAVRKFKDKPNLLCWKIWNEPDIDSCICKDSLAKYRSWLQAQFGSLEEASAYLGRHYSSWEQIKPPIADWDTPGKLLYTRFRLWSASEQARWVVNIVKEEDPAHPVLTDTRSTGTARLDLLGSRIWDDWSMGEVPDIYGGHMHSAAGPAHRSPVDFARPVIDLECKRSATSAASRHTMQGRDHPPSPAGGGSSTSAGAPASGATSPFTGFWMTEIPGGTARALGGVGMHENLLPGEMRYNLWTTIAHGARSVSPWQFKPERIGPEAPGWGVVEMDGTPTYRTAELEEFVRVLREHEELLVSSAPPPARYAVLFSMESSITVSSITSFAYRDAMEGLVAALWRENIYFDIIPTSGDLSQYEAVYLPMPWLVPSGDQHRLVEYMKGGGTVAVEAGFGSYDDNGWYAPKVPTAGMWQQLEYKESDIFRSDTIPFSTEFGPLSGAGERRTVYSTGAEVIGTTSEGTAGKTGHTSSGGTSSGVTSCEEPIVLRSKIGNGQFIYIGSYPSLSFRKSYNPRYARTLTALCGMKPVAWVDSEAPVTCRKLVTDDGKSGSSVYFLFNHSREPAAARIKLPGENRTLNTLYCSGTSSVRQEQKSGLTTIGECSATIEGKGVVLLRFS